VVVPATAGSKGNLFVGKRGIFFDVDGREHDARIVEIVKNPISVREALAAPFVNLWRFVQGKIEAWSGASEKALQAHADNLFKPPPAAPASAPAGGLSSGPAGMLIGLSVSAAAIGSSFAFVTKTLTSLSHSQRLLGVLGALLLVGIPVTLLAVIKLRQQDLSALLEGCGWAVNARMRFTRSLRRQFTRRPRYPEGAVGAPNPRRFQLLVTALLLTALFTLIINLMKGCS
jgi:hypothetical protein